MVCSIFCARVIGLLQLELRTGFGFPERVLYGETSCCLSTTHPTVSFVVWMTPCAMDIGFVGDCCVVDTAGAVVGIIVGVGAGAVVGIIVDVGAGDCITFTSFKPCKGRFSIFFFSSEL